MASKIIMPPMVGVPFLLLAGEAKLANGFANLFSLKEVDDALSENSGNYQRKQNGHCHAKGNELENSGSAEIKLLF